MGPAAQISDVISIGRNRKSRSAVTRLKHDLVSIVSRVLSVRVSGLVFRLFNDAFQISKLHIAPMNMSDELKIVWLGYVVTVLRHGSRTYLEGTVATVRSRRSLKARSRVWDT
jgi:hypothetical protein